MKKRRLGISIYPELAPVEKTMKYIEDAAKHGFDILFMVLLGVKKEDKDKIEFYKKFTYRAKELGYEIFCDVNPMVLEDLGMNPSLLKGSIDLSLLEELKVDVIRLDSGMSPLEEAFLSMNTYGMKVCLNATAAYDHIGNVVKLGGDPDRLIGCHNYYPHRYAGISLRHFEKGTLIWKKYNLRLQSFISSNAEGAFGPWPVTEGLPTLEMHRDWPIEIQLQHYLMMGTVDDIIIGNCFASEEELARLEKANTDITTFHITLEDGVTEDMKKRLKMQLSRRRDENDYIVRSLESRFVKAYVEEFNTVDIKKGDVLIENHLYGQYEGEVQIALQDMKNYGKTNVVAHIRKEEIELLPYLRLGQQFTFEFQ